MLSLFFGGASFKKPNWASNKTKSCFLIPVTYI